jgi:hypothetical protein
MEVEGAAIHAVCIHLLSNMGSRAMTGVLAGMALTSTGMRQPPAADVDRSERLQ